MRTAKHAPRRHPVVRLVAVVMLLGMLGLLAWLIDFGSDAPADTVTAASATGGADTADGDGPAGDADGPGGPGIVAPPPSTTDGAAAGNMADYTLLAEAPADERLGGQLVPIHRELPDGLHLFTFPEPPAPPGMVRIPGGTTVLGTPAEEVEALGQGDETNMTLIAAEVPRHAVSVDEFFLDVTEVTNLQWKVFLEATGRPPSLVLVEYGWPWGVIPEGQEHHPITNVNVPEIRDYLAWCGRRLPAEAEWVRAGRGDGDDAWPWGDRWNALACQSGMSVPQVPGPVGRFPEGAGPHGVLDLAGNVFEWTDSPFEAYPGFEALDLTDRRGRPLRITPEFDGTQKVIKGGAFNSTRELCRVDFRIGFNPTDSDAGLGFRAARTAEPAWDALHWRLGHTRPGHGGGTPRPLTLADLLLDAKQFFGHEVTDRDAERRVITGHRHLAFVPLYAGIVEAWRNPHTGALPPRDPRRHKLEYAAPDVDVAEPILGLLSTTEPLADPPAPPGLYTVTFRPSRPPEGLEDEGGTWGRFRLHPWRAGRDIPVTTDGNWPSLDPLILSQAVDTAEPGATQRFVQRSVSGILNPLWLMALRDQAGRRVRLEFSLGELVTTDDGLIARFHLDLEFEEAWLDG